MTHSNNPAGITYGSELMRKAFHLCSLLIVFGYALMPRTEALLILAVMLEVSFIFDVERQRSPAFRRLLHGTLGWMMRPHELDAKGGGLNLTGSTWVLVAALLTFLIFPKPIALAAFAMLIVCDTAAALVGRRWGTIRFGKKKKSVEGALAFLVTALIVAALTPGLDFRVGIAGAIAATIGEAFPGKLDDNFQVPLAAGVAMVVAQWLLLA